MDALLRMANYFCGIDGAPNEMSEHVPLRNDGEHAKSNHPISGPMRKSVMSGMESIVSYDAESYLARAEECVRLANQTKDEMIQREILLLRQVYLKTAERLRELQKH